MNKHATGTAVWFSSSLFDKTESADLLYCLRHGFSTRHGGNSTGEGLTTLNLGFSVGEDRGITLGNYRHFSEALGIDAGHLLCAHQTHTTEVLTVTEKDRGLGLYETHPLPDGIYADGYDALVTASPDVALTVRTADCVPILFWEPVHHVIGAAHAGWRGTYGKIAAKTVDAMEALGADRREILVCIGHAVGVCCYEIDDAFHDRFLTEFGTAVCENVFVKSPHFENPEKYHCDLRKLNRLILEEAGIPAEKIEVSVLCTCCHPELFFSHRFAMRYQRGKRGLMGAVISMERWKDKSFHHGYLVPSVQNLPL